MTGCCLTCTFVASQLQQSCARVVAKLCFGVQVYEEGTHLMIPWFEWPYIYDVRARPNVIQSTSGSKDLQMVRSMSFAHRSLLPCHVPWEELERSADCSVKKT